MELRTRQLTEKLTVTDKPSLAEDAIGNSGKPEGAVGEVCVGVGAALIAGVSRRHASE
jgi:hypothetical protein